MIIVICHDDNDVFRAAQRDGYNFPDVFGAVYKAGDQIPELGPGENLFISAHGTKIGDDGNAVIGDQAEDYYLNGLELWENIKSIFPDMYSGGVFINACESADWGAEGDVPAFANAFESRMPVRFETEVFGRTGSPGVWDPIPWPGDAAWVREVL